MLIRNGELRRADLTTKGSVELETVGVESKEDAEKKTS